MTTQTQKPNAPRDVIKTASDLKYYVERTKTDSYFFVPLRMHFFGDTMRNYGVREQPVTVVIYDGTKVECWELYRRRPVKHGLQNSAFFSVTDYSRVFPAK